MRDSKQKQIAAFASKIYWVWLFASQTIWLHHTKQAWTNGPQCFAASSTHYVPATFLQVCLKLIFCILFLKIRLSVAKSDSLSQDYTSWPILSLALHIWFHNWRMLCIRASLSQEDTSAVTSQASMEAGNVEKTQNDKPAESWEASPLCVERLCMPASKWAFTVVIRILGTLVALRTYVLDSLSCPESRELKSTAQKTKILQEVSRFGEPQPLGYAYQQKV